MLYLCCMSYLLGQGARELGSWGLTTLFGRYEPDLVLVRKLLFRLVKIGDR